VSIDEMARASARRTSGAFAAVGAPETAYGELVALRRRRTHAKVAALSIVVVAVLLVVFAGSGAWSRRATEPIAPKPSVTKPFRAAPPFCGPGSSGESLSDYVKVGGPCPTGAGRYLSQEMGYATAPPFAFTLPRDWTIEELGGVGGGDVMPALGGLLLRSSRTGDALVLAEYPTEVGATGRLTGTVGASPKSIAQRLAGRSFVQPATVVATQLGGRDAWRVDLVSRPGASYDGHCVLGDRCAVTFALAQDPYPGRSYIGLRPGVPSTALVAKGNGGIVLVAWTWGDPDIDQELRGVLGSIDLTPPVVCRDDALPCAD
jgi:hypothetical protein